MFFRIGLTFFLLSDFLAAIVCAAPIVITRRSTGDPPSNASVASNGSDSRSSSNPNPIPDDAYTVTDENGAVLWSPVVCYVWFEGEEPSHSNDFPRSQIYEQRLYHILQVEDRLTASLVQHNLDSPWPVFKALQPWPDQVTTRIRHCHYRLYRRNQDGIEIPQSHHVAIAFDESAM
ncbi:hypothetical protein FB446DRAFT_235374 [Lentinula raphanica]|nr:hypothetical protein FB446DRAFT_235374 [Lentinula raphanica]